MDVNLKAISCGVALLLSAGCRDSNARATTVAEARVVADAYMAENLPQVRLSKQKIDTTDIGDRWRVSYSLPEGGTGGPIVLIIDKSSGAVVDGEIPQ